jgi:single-strand DNA-binding protein
MAKSLNKAMILGNLTRDPELRYTPNGKAVATFTVATNRTWTTDIGDKREESEFHRVVAWDKLAEICDQLLTKGRKVYIEGRLQTREYENQAGEKKQTTEIVASDMLVLDSRNESQQQPASEPETDETFPF